MMMMMMNLRMFFNTFNKINFLKHVLFLKEITLNKIRSFFEIKNEKNLGNRFLGFYRANIQIFEQKYKINFIRFNKIKSYDN